VVSTIVSDTNSLLGRGGSSFYQGVPKSRWRPIPTAGEGRKRIDRKGVGTKSLGRVVGCTPL